MITLIECCLSAVTAFPALHPGRIGIYIGETFLPGSLAFLVLCLAIVDLFQNCPLCLSVIFFPAKILVGPPSAWSLLYFSHFLLYLYQAPTYQVPRLESFGLHNPSVAHFLFRFELFPNGPSFPHDILLWQEERESNVLLCFFFGNWFPLHTFWSHAEFQLGLLRVHLSPRL